jgi:hypothetical protein
MSRNCGDEAHVSDVPSLSFHKSESVVGHQQEQKEQVGCEKGFHCYS